MKKIQPKFKNYCDTFLRNEEDSVLVYNFYRSLKTPPQAQGDKFLTATQRKKKSLKYLLDNFSVEILLESIRELQRQNEAGEQKANTLIYFNRFVNKFSQNKNTPYSNTETPSNQKIEISFVTPTKKARWTEEYKNEYEKCNWIYSCDKCKGEFDIWQKVCPGCATIIDWEKLEF